MRAEIAVFVLNLSDIIFLRTAPHTDAPSQTTGWCLRERWWARCSSQMLVKKWDHFTPQEASPIATRWNVS